MMAHDTVPLLLYTLAFLLLGVLAIVHWIDEHVSAAARHTP